MNRPFLLFLLLLAACDGDGSKAASAARPFVATPIATFDEPWAMAFLPEGQYVLITEKAGRLKLWQTYSRTSIDVTGVPAVEYGGQGGLGDVIVHPDFANNGYVYLSYAEAGGGGRRGAAVARGRLIIDETSEGEASLENVTVIWRQEPKVSGQGHYAGRMAFSPEGHLFITSGDRQKFSPAQDMNQNLGKILRLTDAGGIPSDNPFHDQGRIKAQVWSFGHRNPLGLAFDAQGRLWEHEMGPWGGDEFNLIAKGRNYGWPIVSNGEHYDGRPIPDHGRRPDLEAPEISWTPVISPAGLIIYSGEMFPAWKGSALLGGLSGQALVRLAIDGETAREAERFDMGERIREVEQGPDGAVWLLEDGPGGRLLKLTPR